MSPQQLRQAAAQRRRFARDARRAGREIGAASHLTVITCTPDEDSDLMWGPLVEHGEADSMDGQLRDILLSRGWREVSGGSGRDPRWGTYLAEDYRFEPPGLDEIEDINVILAAPIVEIAIVGIFGGDDDLADIHYTATRFGANPSAPQRYVTRPDILADLQAWEAISTAWSPPAPH